MWIIFNKFRIRRILKRYPIPQSLWDESLSEIPLLKGLSEAERSRLRNITTVFLYDKHFTGAQGLEITPEMRLTIAVQAGFLVLNLGIEYYSGWVEIIVYPAAFRVTRPSVDSAGVVHNEDKALSGESWSRGPLILSWSDVVRDTQVNNPGRNVVIHEFAHKLDMLNGIANGMPLLHTDMSREAWTEALSSAYDFLNQQLRFGSQTVVNAYAATDPAEFFAVTTEYFFTAPNLLAEHCPYVYEQLKRYYRQDSIKRFDF